MRHLVGHSYNELEVVLCFLLNELELIDIDCHCFQSVQGPQAFLNASQPLPRHPLPSEFEVF